MPELKQNIRPYRGRLPRSLAAVLAAIFIFGLVSLGQAAPPAPEGAKPAETAEPPEADKPDQAAGQELLEVRLGTLPDYTRLVMTFSKPVDSYKVVRVDVDQLMLNFGPARTAKQGRMGISDRLIQGVLVAEQFGQLITKIKLHPSRFNFRHFLSPDRLSVIVDFRSEIPPVTGPGSEKTADILDLKIPPIKETASLIRQQLPYRPQPGTDQALLAEAAERAMAGNYDMAIKDLEDFKLNFPDSKLNDPALFFLGDLYYAKGQLADDFLKITDSYQTALTFYPDSSQAPRVKLMLGMAYMKMDFLNEAVSYFKEVAREYPDTMYAPLANTFLGEMYLNLGKRELAKAAFDTALAANAGGSLFLNAYYKLGLSFYQDGLFSESTEVFKEIVKRDPEFYVNHPEILTYLGEGYFYLGRYDLARAFIFHSLNMMPEQPDADILMARLGDSYKADGLDKDAVKMYSLDVSLHPDSAGALISRMRLADYGALRVLFPKDEIFMNLERGALAAMLELYQGILNTEQESPLLELAMFKLGQIYLKRENYPKALEVFKDMLGKYPQGTLAEEALRLASDSVLNQLRILYQLQRDEELIRFYADNKQYVSQDAWPEVRHYLGIAYARLNKPEESTELLEANKGFSDDERERLLTLGRSYLKLGRYEKAAQNLNEYREKYPDDDQVPNTYLEQARLEMTLGYDDLALDHLEKAVAQRPAWNDDPEVQEMLARLYMKKGDLEQGVAAMEKTIEFLKEDPGAADRLFLAYARLGQAYLDLGETAKAEQAFDAALAVDTKKRPPENIYLMAQGYRQLELPEKYKETLSLLLKSPQPFWRDAAQQELEAWTPGEKITRLLEQGPVVKQQEEP